MKYLLFFFVLAGPLQAQLLHDYELNVDYLDAFGGNPMVPNGGFLNGTEYVFGPDQGPNVSGVIDPGTYCIQLKFTPLATSGWRKILDFKNRTSDNGLYIYNNRLQFYPYPAGPDIAFSPGVPVTVLFIRDGATGEMSGYVNGVWQWTITDSPNDATFTGPGNIIYILIDDLAVPGESMSGSLDFFKISGLNVGTLDLDLGDDVTTCDPYEIDPGWTGVEFHWSDGSTGSTLVVTESGTYALTITEGCSGIGIDSVEVIFDGVDEAVDIGPPEVTICEGDSYVISLDPNIGDYVWQDGSTDPEYSITTSGLYQVSFDDGCDVTTDEINVLVLDSPDPFTLGNDTTLCSGDEITFSFDPSLGDFEWQDGSQSSNYVIDQEGIYELIISNACGEYVDDIEVIAIPLPEIDLGSDQLQLCEGQEIEFNFNPNWGEYVWQDGTNSESYIITEPGNYSVTMTNECGFSSDQVEVVLQSMPVFELGNDIIICPAQLPITLDVGNATNATFFQWQDGSTDSQYQVNTGGSFSVTVSNDCFSTVDQIDVVLQDNMPVVVLPADQTLCPGQTFLLDASGIPGIYLWQDGSTSSVFNVTQEGTYSLSVTDQCGMGSDSIIINYFDSLSSPDLGADVNLCPGEQYVFYAGVTGVGYAWQDGSTADSLIVSAAGTYSLTITDACTSAFDSATVTISNNPPQVDLAASLSLCQSDTVIIDPGISGVQFTWNDGSSASTLTVTNPGAYSLTVSNSCGTDTDTIQIMDAGSIPTVDLGQDIALCIGDVSIIQPVSSGVNSWLWQDGSTSSTFTASGPGTISVQVMNNCGISYDTLMVTSLPAVPLLQLGSDTALCPGETLSLNILSPGVNVLWSDGSTSSNFNVTGPGLVYASITNACGTSTDTISITSLPAVPMLNLGVDQFLCPGDVITLSPEILGVDYVWQDGSTSQSFNAIQGGTITLTISNYCGSVSDTMVITENTNGPLVDLGPDILECEGTVVTLNPGLSGVSYLWQDGSSSPVYVTSVSGTFIVQVSNSCGVDIDTINVEISGVAPQTDLGKDTLLCEGETLLLNANPDAETSVVWQDGSIFPSFTVTEAGTYTLAAFNQCGSASDTINISIEVAPPAFSLGPDTTLCPGESIQLIAPQSNLNITWQDGSHGLSLIADHALLYSLQLSNDCGTSSDDLLVSFDSNVPNVNVEPIPWCEGDVPTLDVTQSFNATYIWNDGSVLPFIHVDAPGLYGVLVSTACHSVQKDIEVFLSDDCLDGIYIPTVFSPNGDGVNDTWRIYSSDQKAELVSLSIFDRWGGIMYYCVDKLLNDSSVEWDGRMKGKEMESGVFVFVAFVKMNNGASRQIKGDITLIR